MNEIKLSTHEEFMHACAGNLAYSLRHTVKFNPFKSKLRKVEDYIIYSINSNGTENIRKYIDAACKKYNLDIKEFCENSIWGIYYNV